MDGRFTCSQAVSHLLNMYLGLIIWGTWVRLGTLGMLGTHTSMVPFTASCISRVSNLTALCVALGFMILGQSCLMALVLRGNLVFPRLLSESMPALLSRHHPQNWSKRSKSSSLTQCFTQILLPLKSSFHFPLGSCNPITHNTLCSPCRNPPGNMGRCQLSPRPSPTPRPCPVPVMSPSRVDAMPIPMPLPMPCKGKVHQAP